MADPTGSLYEAKNSFEIEVVGVGSMRIYQVLEQDLDRLQASGDFETLFLAFMCLCVGALISAVLAWIGAGALSAWAFATYVCSTGTLGVASVLLTLLWWKARASRVKASADIRSRTGTVQTVLATEPRGLGS
jgi:hypothetical protein